MDLVCEHCGEMRTVIVDGRCEVCRNAKDGDFDRTAMSRTAPSKPLHLALAAGIVTTKTRVLDYGCGRGDDVRWLRAKGIDAVGYDPRGWSGVHSAVFFDSLEHWTAEFDVVLLTYVLNVIPDRAKRDEVLRDAFKRSCTLVAAVRTDFAAFKGCKRQWFPSTGVVTQGPQERRDWVYVTASGTMQRPYRAREFRRYVADTLWGERIGLDDPDQLAPGVVVVE